MSQLQVQSQPLIHFAPIPAGYLKNMGRLYDLTFIIRWLVESGIKEKDLFDAAYNRSVQNEIYTTPMDSDFKALVIMCLNFYLS